MAVEEREYDDLLPRLQNIDPIDFEHFVADLWEKQGWETTVSQESNDQGVDIIADKEIGGVKHRQVIQAKRYSEGNKIGRPSVQQYHTMKVQDQKADIAVVVTTSSFTSTAEKWANENNVKLIDGDDLVEVIKKENANSLVEKYAPSLSTSSITPAKEHETDDESSNLPSPLDDPEIRKKVSIGAGLVGLYFIWNPTGIGFPVEALGTLLALGAVGFVLYPEEMWEAITPEKEVIRDFDDGSEIYERKNTVVYSPADDRDNIKFDELDHVEDRRQRAAVYASLDQTWGPLEEHSAGSIPTNIASQGEGTIVAYRYAVHAETPATIADDMKITQKEAVNYLSNIAQEE